MPATAIPRSFQRLGVLSTLVDAGVAFARGRSVSGVLLLRVYRRFR